MIRSKKEDAIQSAFWQSTVYAAFQRARVYADGATGEDRRGVKQTLKAAINELVPKYRSRVREKTHVNRILAIKKQIDRQWRDALISGGMPIGVIQKAFNLYLKLLWCRGRVAEPPHCPLDKIIIDSLPVKQRRPWTRISDIETYEVLIKNLKVVAGEKNLSLATWELVTYKKPGEEN